MRDTQDPIGIRMLHVCDPATNVWPEKAHAVYAAAGARLNNQPPRHAWKRPSLPTEWCRVLERNDVAMDPHAKPG